MAYLRPEWLTDSDVAQARRDARVVLQVARARFSVGDGLDDGPLARLVEDERLTPRLRTRAAEYLARAALARLQADVGRALGGTGADPMPRS